MPLDRSDKYRTWVPMHTGSKNRVRLNWQSRTTARRTERLAGVPVNPITGEVDVKAALLAGIDEAAIAAALLEEMS